MSDKYRYHYQGPVNKFGKFIGYWEADTIAVSKRKALANLSYRYKTAHNMVKSTKISLDPNCIQAVDTVNENGRGYHQMTIDEVLSREDFML